MSLVCAPADSQGLPWTAPADTGWDDPGLLSRGALLAFAGAIGLPVALHLTGMSPVNRLAYPGLALVIGGILYARRSPWYLGYCLWLFCACALVRRLADHAGGFQPSSAILLAPYLACCLSAAGALRYLGPGRNAGGLPLALMLGVIAYGAAVAVLQERLTLGLVDALKWAVGPLAVVHLLALDDRRAAASRACLSTALVAAAPLMAAYGIAQFVSPAPWDADWVANVVQIGFNSIGVPEPYGLRVFGPMHGPGSLAAYLMAAVILTCGQGPRLALPGVLVCVLCLGLCQYRTVWAGTAVGLLLVTLWGTARIRLGVAAGIALLVLGLSAIALVPEIQFVLERRFASLAEIQADASGADRLAQYVFFFLEFDAPFLGMGLGLNYQSAVSGQVIKALDSGLLDTARTFGLFGGALYLASLGSLLAGMFGGRLRDPRGYLFRAAAIACFIQIPQGSVQTAEAGFLGFLMLGAALSARSRHATPHRGGPGPTTRHGGLSG